MENPPETSSETIDLEEQANAESEADSHGGDSNKKSGKPPRAKKKKIALTPEMKADPISRKLILFSLFFAALAILCIGLLTRIYLEKKHAHDPVETVTHSVEPIVIFSQALDEIHVVLKNEQDLRVELVTECSDKETCEFIKNNQAQVRDSLIPILSNIDSDLFSNLENKREVRKQLAEEINTIPMPGKVIQIHFNNLSIEGKPQ